MESNAETMSPGRGTATDPGATADGDGGVVADEETDPNGTAGDDGEPDVDVQAANTASAKSAGNRLTCGR
jgi:hypothetical protein